MNAHDLDALVRETETVFSTDVRFPFLKRLPSGASGVGYVFIDLQKSGAKFVAKRVRNDKDELDALRREIAIIRGSLLFRFLFLLWTVAE